MRHPLRHSLHFHNCRDLPHVGDAHLLKAPAATFRASRSFYNLTGFLYESCDDVLHPTMRLLLNRQGLQAELLAPDPAHHRSSHNDASFDRQIDGQGTRLSNVYGNIAREFPPAQRKVPDSALSLEQASVVRDGAVDGEALVETNRERHEEPRRERIVGEGQSNRKAGVRK